MATYVEPRPAVTERQASVGLLSWRWPIVGILVLQAVVSLAILRNTAFQDEALYLYAGRQIIHHWNGGPAPYDHYAFYFSGYPYVYPIIGGFLDMAGGLELARAFSLACMLSVTTIVYWVTGKLFQRTAAILASAAYACTGVVLFLGRLATFDALCLLLIAVATALAVHGGMSRRPWTVAAIGPVLVLAILAKYAALLFVLPVFALLVCLSISSVGWWRSLIRLLLALASLALSLAAAYRVIDKAAFHAISGSTTSRMVILQTPRISLFGHVLQMGGVIFFLAIVGALLALRLEWRYRALAVILLASSALAPAYHIYVQETISLDKHIAYALFFAMPLVGYALAWLSGYERQSLFGLFRGYWLAGVAVILAIFALGLGQARSLYNWANTSDLNTALHTQLRDGTGRMLAEDIEVVRFDTLDVTDPWQWSGVRFDYYVDAANHQYLGDPAIAHAIKDRYYDLIELSFVYLPAEANFTAEQMAITRNYDLIEEILFSNSFGKGHFYLFRLALSPGHGDFTSLKQLKPTYWGT